MGNDFIALILTMAISQLFSALFPSLAALSFLSWIIIFPILLSFLSKYSLSKKRGLVSSTGIKGYNQNTEIPFDKVYNITGGQGIQNIITADGQVEISLPKQEIIKLSQTVLNNWTLNDYSVNIIPGASETPLTVTYSPMGKYALKLLPTLYFFLVINFLFVPFQYFVLAYALQAGIYFVFRKYPQVKVKIHDGGLSTIENGQENFISFKEIQVVKKNILYINITTRDKRTFILPKQCLYLYELLELHVRPLDS